LNGEGDEQMKRTWPDDWESRKRGDSCPFCEDLYARSFHSGRASEAILEGNAIANGHAAVVFRGRHIAAFTDLSSNELADYSQDIQTVGLIIERVFRPCHVNYLLLGNIVPHLHVHVVPRYLDDAAPERPLPWNPSPVSEKTFAEQFKRLREAASSLRTE
jgi:diadenosine tetraphosphate (Ap4A) HIT family hydrolase